MIANIPAAARVNGEGGILAGVFCSDNSCLDSVTVEVESGGQLFGSQTVHLVFCSLGLLNLLEPEVRPNESRLSVKKKESRCVATFSFSYQLWFSQ